ncbi:outer membrane insertion signal domain protein [Ancylostoma caninum]|uniref:Outer membrane insertion signal domain protein n=1 Tax=Ancylostoma caninum TaxID=29170 RepID=A0A368FLP0_ANCCA|nr:outer membrane insertion signal domain protein [Ancylostoma caninum]
MVIEKLQDIPSDQFALGMLERTNPASAVERAVGPCYDNDFLPEIMGDLFLNVAVLQSVISLLESGVKPLFFYDFDFFNPDSWGPSLKLHFKEATHSTDVAYVFGLGINYDFTFTADDIKMLNQTTTLWTNFVKYG